MIRPTVTWKKRGVDGALARLVKRAELDVRRTRKMVYRLVNEIRDAMARELQSRTGLPYKQARRRLRIIKGRKRERKKAGANVFAAIAVSQNASTIHAGRIKGVRRGRGRRNRNEVLAVPGVELKGRAFLLAPKRFKGERRRVYQRIGDRIESVNLSHRISTTMREFMAVKGRKMIAARFRLERRGQPKRTALVS